MSKLGEVIITKYLKLLWLLGVAIFLSGLLLLKPFSGYYHVFPVTYGKYKYPFITTEFQGSTRTLGVRIGWRFPLLLREKTLNDIDRQYCGTEIIRSEMGQRRAPSYHIPKLKIGDLVLKNSTAYQSDVEDYDILGKFLGGDVNLLLDFPNDRIIACNSFVKLQDKKDVGTDWIRVPFEMHRAGIVFSVQTGLGPRKLLLNTGSTRNVLKITAISSNTAGRFVTPLSLEGCSFGNVTFDVLEMYEDLPEIDGNIGMDFLKENALYLDYTHKLAYVAPPQKYLERIPVSFNIRGAPIIDVSLENEVYPMKLDLGTAISFCISKEVLTKTNKDKYGTYKWCDFRGKPYESPTYNVPEIKIGNLKFPNVTIAQDSEEFHANATLIGEPLHLPGVIGLGILNRYNLLLDFPHNAVYACSDLSLLQQSGRFSNHFLAVPFISGSDGIFLNVETDMGTQLLMVDTGATASAIRVPHPSSTEKFSIMGHDFGKQFVMPIDLSPQIEFDGFLGMNFFHEYPIFIDYVNKVLFIDLEKSR